MENKKYKVAPGVSKSIYPLEYNRNDPMSGFNAWTEYIRKENVKNMYKGNVMLFGMRINLYLFEEVLEEKRTVAGQRLVNEALKIINKN